MNIDLGLLLDALQGNTQLAGLLVGLFTPLLTAVAQRPGFSTRKRTAIGVGTSLVLGTLTVAAAGKLSVDDGATILATLGTVVVGAEAAYSKFWQQRGTTQRIEYATTPNNAL